MKINHVTIAATLMMLFCLPSVASADSAWAFRFHGALLNSSASYASDVEGYGAFSARAHSGAGIGAGLEYSINKAIGIEVSLSWAEVDVDFVLVDGLTVQNDSDRLSMRPLTLAINLHLTPRLKFDLFVAPSINRIDYRDIQVDLPRLDRREVLSTGSDTAPGVALGVDIPFGEGGWAFSMALRYIRSESRETDNPPGTSPIRVDIDPTILAVGLAYKF